MCVRSGKRGGSTTVNASHNPSLVRPFQQRPIAFPISESQSVSGISIGSQVFANSAKFFMPGTVRCHERAGITPLLDFDLGSNDLRNSQGLTDQADVQIWTRREENHSVSLRLMLFDEMQHVAMASGSHHAGRKGLCPAIDILDGQSANYSPEQSFLHDSGGNAAKPKPNYIERKQEHVRAESRKTDQAAGKEWNEGIRTSNRPIKVEDHQLSRRISSRCLKVDAHGTNLAPRA
jgi:hypothetical protein